jgi:alkanesulfonate monooxygenase SsuD/methylene tetrahydromethanopterin reductase-like flavin-dependent oxidoreductase (luciferase family)
MRIHAEGHWGGNPHVAVGTHLITTETVAEARDLAELHKFLEEFGSAGLKALARVCAESEGDGPDEPDPNILPFQPLTIGSSPYAYAANNL